MEIYLVGGAVRDFLLAEIQGFLSTPEEIDRYWRQVEKDWVVVGATPSEMKELGYRQVGKSFPVFLHPTTQEEYALARTERKVGKGYTGFECHADPSVTLEDDLKRRDLTINAIAMHVLSNDFTQFELIDPYKGLEDLKRQLFRHVSPAFAEDPVRILRLARFATRFDKFNMDPVTVDLMKQMVEAGELEALVPERVWQEWARSLSASSPWRFFEILEVCGALAPLFPELEQFEFKKTVLAKAVTEAEPATIRLAIELFDLTPLQAKKLTDRFRIPHEFRDLAVLVATLYPEYKSLIWTPDNLLHLFESADAFRRPARLEAFMRVCDLLEESQLQSTDRSTLERILHEVRQIDIQDIVSKGLEGTEIAAELRLRRIQKIEELLRSLPK